MAKYIDADKLLNNLSNDLPYKGSVKRVLLQAPSADVVEVVRCKDCKNFTCKCEEFLVDDVVGRCERSRTGFYDDREEVYGNDFCSYGERRYKNE